LKKRKLLISVVVPAYNEEKWIGRCLAALKKQTFPKSDYEIIVVDNNSTDQTAQIAEKAGVKVIFEKKQGNVFALRKGCSQARGEIIAMTDADTLVPRDWLKKIYQAYQESPQVVCVGGRAVFRPRNWLSIINEPVWNLGGLIFKNCPGFNLSIKKDIYQKIGGFRKEVNFDGDFDLCLRVRKKGKIVFLWDNPVISSSRHFQGIEGVTYCLKGTVNITHLVLFNKPLLFEFGAVR
jgi:cellulose synthase/poly-beta-1,6-N-acetylglucosamine synthase-like glycosyltransferase